MVPTIEQAKPKSIALDHLIRFKNEQFLDTEKYGHISITSTGWIDLGFNPDGTPKDRSENKSIADLFETGIVELCMETDFCKQTGLSYIDILKLDLPTYHKLRKKLFAVLDKKAKHHEAIRRETEAQSSRL